MSGVLVLDAEVHLPESITFTDITFAGCDFHLGDDVVITLGDNAYIKKCIIYAEYSEDGRQVVIAQTADQVTDTEFTLP